VGEGNSARGGNRFRTVAAVAAIAVTVGVVGSAIASQLASGVDTYTGCLSTSGDLTKVAKGSAPAKACTGSQSQISLSGPLPQDCSTGDVLRWNAGWTCGADARAEVFVARQSGQPFVLPGTGAEVLRLSLAPGKYEVTGKIALLARSPSGPFLAQCFLVPSDPDGTPGSLNGPGTDVASLRLAPAGSAADQGGIVLAVSEELTASGAVSLRCGGSGEAAGALATRTAIRAIKVDTITTTDSPGPLP